MRPLSEPILRDRGAGGSARWRAATLAVIVLCAFLPAATALRAASLTAVTEVRFWTLGNTTRVVVETKGDFHVRSERLHKPERIYFDILQSQKRLGDRGVHVIPVDDSQLKQIRVAQTKNDVTRIVLDLNGAFPVTASQLSRPDRLILEIRSPETEHTVLSSSKTGNVRVSEAPVKPRDGDFDETADRQTNDDSAATPSRETPTRPEPVLSQAPPKTNGSRRSSSKTKRTASSTAKAESAKAGSAAPLETAKSARGEAEKVESTASSDQPKAANSAPAEAVKTETAKAETAPAPTEIASVRETPPRRTPPPALTESKAPAADDNASPGGVPVPAQTNSNRAPSLTRALGLKFGKVVIDPGHGGHDHGTTGLSGVVEKELVLDVSRRLAQLIEERLQSEVVLTRDSDVFIPLEERTAIANRSKADLFISIHANASPLRAASGVETYYLNFTTSKTAMEVAARENAGHNKSIHELQDLIQKIALKDKIDESREFANKVETSMVRKLTRSTGPTRNRGVKQAPFVVLIGAAMPSILTEIGFVSNPREAKLLATPEYRQKLAEALFEGVSAYAGTLSRFDVASKD